MPISESAHSWRRHPSALLQARVYLPGTVEVYDQERQIGATHLTLQSGLAVDRYARLGGLACAAAAGNVACTASPIVRHPGRPK
jgi:hypothetical protein